MWLPDLISGNFLHYLYLLARREPLSDDWIISQQAQADIPLLFASFETGLDGSLDKLLELVTLQLHILRTFPRLLISFANVVQMVTILLEELHRRRFTDSPDASTEIRSQFEHAHHTWVDMKNCIDALLDRQVSQVTSDGISYATTALADMLKICLLGPHPLATRAVEKHQESFPGLGRDWVPEAMASEWRFQVMEKLIRSSQMQLRVWAVTTMCNELVAMWRRFQDDVDHPILKHLSNCLLQSGLIDYILGPGCHPEIIAESANIIGFLVVTKTYQKQHTDRIWHNITQSQDQRVADALVRLIIGIVNIFDQEHLLDFCEKFLDLPIESYTLSIKTLWNTMISQLADKAQKNQSLLSHQPYDLCLKLLRESSGHLHATQSSNSEMYHNVVQKLRELLKYGPDDEGRANLYASCVDDISKKSSTSLGSLWFLMIATRQSMAMERQLNVLTKDYGFLTIMIEEFEAAVDLSRTSATPAALWGAPNQPRREFLAGLIQYQPGMIDEVHRTRLWDLLVGPRSASAHDREAGWQILNDSVAKSEGKNPFISACLAQHLPSLPSECFCAGLLDFVKNEVIKLMGDARDFQLDDENFVKSSCLEQLWAIILDTDEQVLANQAIHFLAVEVYMSASVVTRLSSSRLRQAHSLLVSRCLEQLKAATQNIRGENSIDDSGNDGEAMVIVENDEQVQRQERIFTRSLQLLRYFLDIYQTRPDLSTPDLRALMSRAPSAIEGDPTQLKYQSFDGPQQTEMKPLNIGKLNTAASLLASLRHETGFRNYRAYYRGQPFSPDMRQICQSLEDLQVHEGLILVQRADEPKDDNGGERIKLGASALQIDIMRHFDELCQYLDLKDQLAQEVKKDLQFACQNGFFTDQIRYIISLLSYPPITAFSSHSRMRRFKRHTYSRPVNLGNHSTPYMRSTNTRI